MASIARSRCQNVIQQLHHGWKFALIQNRLAMAAVNDFQNIVLPMIRIHLVDELLHLAGKSALLTAGQNTLSLVDCISLAVMRKQGILKAFAYEDHCSRQ